MDNHLDAFDIDATGCDIGGNQGGAISIDKSFHRPVTLIL